MVSAHLTVTPNTNKGVSCVSLLYRCRRVCKRDWGKQMVLVQLKCTSPVLLLCQSSCSNDACRTQEVWANTNEVYQIQAEYFIFPPPKKKFFKHQVTTPTTPLRYILKKCLCHPKETNCLTRVFCEQLAEEVKFIYCPWTSEKLIVVVTLQGKCLSCKVCD